MSQWKAGKTTLVSVLLSRMSKGGRLAGLEVAPARAVVVSEESAEAWYRRMEPLGGAEHVNWVFRPFAGTPRMEQWEELCRQIGTLGREGGVELVVIDSLATFFPQASENQAASVLAAVKPLGALAAAGMAVLLVHHPAKGWRKEGQVARGSGALAGYVDILIEMDWYGRGGDLDRRRLKAWSRHRETPRQLVIEMTEDASDYDALGAFGAYEFWAHWEVLRGVFEDAKDELTRQQVLAEWPPDYAKPSSATLWRWLNQAVAEGLLHTAGRGRKRDPFTYWLAAHAKEVNARRAERKQERQEMEETLEETIAIVAERLKRRR